MKTTELLIILISVLNTQFLIGQSSFEKDELQSEYTLMISWTDETISPDGVLDEKIWDSSPMATDFMMSYPYDDRPSSNDHRTEVWMAYDDTYIYVAAKCYAPAPYVVQSLKRDAFEFWDGDVFGITLDPLNEGTNAFSFNTNPSGVQFDAIVSGQLGSRSSGGGGGITSAWDNKWISNSQIHDDHWTCEIAIPFKSIRYGQNTKWGMNFTREVSIDKSTHSWTPVPIQFMTIDMSYFGALIWDKTPPQSRSNIALIPYALGSRSHDIIEGRSCNPMGFYDRGRGVTIHGTDGTVLMDRGGYEIFDIKGRSLSKKSEAEIKDETNLVGGGDMTTKHMSNFCEGIRTGAKLHSPIDDGYISNLMPHLGNIAQSTGRILDLDPQTGRILNDPDAMKMWGRSYEPGWEPTL
jgi:hypothetical protein